MPAMQASDFFYELPPELIAQAPLAERPASRLLVPGDPPHDLYFSDLPSLLREGDLLVLNDTRVIPARLFGQKQTGGKIEVLLERVLNEHEALVQIGSSRSPKAGASLEFDEGVTAEMLGREDSFFVLRFNQPALEVFEQQGHMPLPPYIDRADDPSDRDRYQTVFAEQPGAVAAPTAGLHFDAELLAQIRAAGVNTAHITLHVGAGTFQPVKQEQIDAARLHSERLRVDADLCQQIRDTRAAGGRVVAVGTTVVRALESAVNGDVIAPFEGETTLFIQPGYRFRVVDALVTNFHLPESSLLMLVSAFAGKDEVLAAYNYAVEQRYRFFSYGDAMFLERKS